MITLSPNKNAPVNAVLRVSMVVGGERREKGAVVELSKSDFVYLSQHDRVAEATAENVAAVKAEVAAEAKRGATPSEADILRARLKDAEAELAAFKKGK